MGEPYGIRFGELSLLSNSRLALEAGEYAKNNGKFDEFHEKIFYACFTEGQDIGKIDVVLDAARSVCLDVNELTYSLENKIFSENVDDNFREASAYDVEGTPTFIINNKYKLVGAQPLKSFRTALLNIEKNEAE